jgi:hypothetical protein
MMVERISTRRESKAWQLDFLALIASNTRTFDRNATSTECDFALCGSSPSGTSIWISFPSRAAEVIAVLLHHRLQNLLACIDAEFEERFLDACKDFQQRKRDLHGHRLWRIDGLEISGIPGMLSHGGGSFKGLVTPSVTHGG